MGYVGAAIMIGGALMSAQQKEKDRKKFNERNELSEEMQEMRNAQIDEQVRFNINALSGVATDIERQKVNGDVAAIASSKQQQANISAIAASQGFGGSTLQYALDDIEKTMGANLLNNADKLRQGMSGIDKKITSLQMEGEAAKAYQTYDDIDADSPVMTLMNVALAGAQGYQAGSKFSDAWESNRQVGSTGNSSSQATTNSRRLASSIRRTKQVNMIRRKY